MDNFLKQDEHNKQRKIIYKDLLNIDLYLKKSPSIETIHHAPGTLNSRLKSGVRNLIYIYRNFNF